MQRETRSDARQLRLVEARSQRAVEHRERARLRDTLRQRRRRSEQRDGVGVCSRRRFPRPATGEEGQGEQRLLDYVAQHERNHNTHCAIYQVRRRCNPVSYEEMADVATIWVDTALALEESDLRKMERLVVAQNRRIERLTPGFERVVAEPIAPTGRIQG